MTIIITRNGLWLDAFYNWGVIPHCFEWWHGRDVLEMMMGTLKKPTGYAVVEPGVVDLDTVKIEAI